MAIYPPRRFDDEHSIEADPRAIAHEKPPKAVDLSLREFFRRVRMGKRSRHAAAVRPQKQHLQRCTVQVRYTRGGSPGKWYSHGSYIAREAKTRQNGEGLGFNADRTDVRVAHDLAEWRRCEDQLFFRVILSPEFGDRLDLLNLTRDTMEQMERDIGTRLEWMAVAHFNTDKPHVHVVIRGLRDDGRTLRISRKYIKEGLRNRAAEAATQQLGYRTQEDLLEVHRREVQQPRFTGVDRKLMARQGADSPVRVDPSNPNLQDVDRTTEFHLERRLFALAEMGLAERNAVGDWTLAPELETSLRTVQKTLDRVQMMAAYGEMASGEMPFRMLKLAELDEIEGKVLVHGQDEFSGSNFTIMESVRGEIVRVPQTREIAAARSHRGLQPGSYMRLKRTSEDSFDMQDLGDAEMVITNERFLEENARWLQDMIPTGFEGWIGRLRTAVTATRGRSSR